MRSIKHTASTGTRTHLLLVAAMALVITLATAVSMLLVRHRLQAQVKDDFARDLQHSEIAFQELQAVRLESLDRETALLADLPTLKALMTSGDGPTIRDGAVEFWKLSGADLFALMDAHDHVIAAYTQTAVPGPALDHDLTALLSSPAKHFLVHDRALYACSVRPIFFNGEAHGTLLGYVVSGSSIERTVRQISLPAGVEAAFLSDNHVVASTLPPVTQAALYANPVIFSNLPHGPSAVEIGAGRYLVAEEELSPAATSSLRLIVLKSFAPAERWIARIDNLMLGAGLLALFVGMTLMVGFSRVLTRPLEELSASMRAFGTGDGQFDVPHRGTREIRQLSLSFEGMRDEIRRVQGALLESERLATIGSMASSVSHDLRHYLAAVYANAEFLASGRLTAGERAEIFGDIRTAVEGTTEMLESLLIFSRTGNLLHAPEFLSVLLERAVQVVRAHPDAEGIRLVTHCDEPGQTAILAEGRQMERAIYNLLLNACQSCGLARDSAVVMATLQVHGEDISLRIADNGPGVPASIRDSLFKPFVSEGKQKGTGLGLTLAYTVAHEHRGRLMLESSRPGETVFHLSLPRVNAAPLRAALAVPVKASPQQLPSSISGRGCMMASCAERL